MIVLGIDSSTDHLAVGLADGDRIMAEDRLDSAREHASHIIGMIDSLLKNESLAKTDLEGLAVAVGPGSFTGLRIGMAVARGMVRALAVPAAGISTFEVIADRLADDYRSYYLAAVARKGEYYLCRIEPGTEIVSGMTLIAEEDLPARVGKDPVGIVGRVPDGWADLVSETIDPGRLYISGGELAVIGARRIMAGKVDGTSVPEPLYVAPSQAERKFGRS